MPELREPYTTDAGVTHTVTLDNSSANPYLNEARWKCSCGKHGKNTTKARAISGGRQHISELWLADGKQPPK